MTLTPQPTPVVLDALVLVRAETLRDGGRRA